jgi:cysteinyl-tRNA synthetase
VLADKLRDTGEVVLPPGLYASQRPSEQRVPRLRHQYASGAYRVVTEAFLARFIEAMDDDLNTPNAIAALFDYVSALYAGGVEQCTDPASLLAVYRTLVRHLAVFGVEIAEPRLYPQLIAEYAGPVDEESKGRGGDALVDRLLALRLEARRAKDFAKADAIRNLLTEAGALLEDTPSGPRWSAQEK